MIACRGCRGCRGLPGIAGDAGDCRGSFSPSEHGTHALEYLTPVEIFPASIGIIPGIPGIPGIMAVVGRRFSILSEQGVHSRSSLRARILDDVHQRGVLPLHRLAAVLLERPGNIGRGPCLPCKRR